jgi:hypothetical protein
VPPDALLTGLAVLTLLSDLATQRPLLVAVDDAQWLDRGSLDALAFAARRFEDERLVLLVGARARSRPRGSNGTSRSSGLGRLAAAMPGGCSMPSRGRRAGGPGSRSWHRPRATRWR